MIYQRETQEFLPVAVTRDGAPITTGIEHAITPYGTRATTWTAPTILSGKTGVMVQGLAPGEYIVWTRITTAGETPVLQTITFEVV